MTMMAAVLEISGITKCFGSTLALDGVDLAVRPHEVHALIGENGAGKSTLMNILSASVRPDGGSIHFQGRPYRPSGPMDARRRGVAHIHQELSLCPHLSVAENICLGTEPRRSGWLDQRELNRQAEELLEKFHHPAITPRRRVADLPLAARQIVEICRALSQRTSLILMDEPTSSLQRADVERLFSFIRQLRDSGISIIYISHFLEEVREIADTCTVLRDGKSVVTGPMPEMPNEKLIAAMAGRSVNELFPARATLGSPARAGEGSGAAPEPDCVLEAKNLSAPPAVRQATLQLRRGEILGIAGLIGSGRTELVRALFGLEKPRGGNISIFGKPSPLHGTPTARIALGLGYLSEDRKGEGLALPLSLADNITLTNLGSCSQHGWIDLVKQQEQAQKSADAVQVRAATMNLPVQKLSGGNQQKAALARLLHQGCEVFLLDEPTRGVDVASKAQIYAIIVGLARAGKAVLMVSSYLPELFGICDRLAVMSRGRLSAARPISEWTPETVLQAAIGASE